jgi:hypothetical protein
MEISRDFQGMVKNILFFKFSKNTVEIFLRKVD